MPTSPRPSAAVLTAHVDSVVRTNILAQGAPSASVVVTRGNETLVQRAWGLADVASGRAADPSTIYRLGSLGKQFTAVLLLKLADRGRLSLGDSISRYLTGLRPEWKAITIEQLLNHTSGLPRDFRDPDRHTQNRSDAALVAMAARDAMVAQPGTTFLYSNTGYMLLGVLVEKLHGKPYGVALRDEIARPLGLTTLRFCGDTGEGREATAYRRSPNGTRSPIKPVHASQALGSGGVCATASDVAQWNRALHGGQVLSAASYAAMTTPRGAAAPHHYGFGLYVRPAPWGSPVMVHGGQTSGYTAENAWYPDESLSVTVLYNAYPRVPPFGGTDLIAALALGRTPPPPPRAEPTVAALGTPATSIIGEEARQKFVGDYEPAPGVVFKITFERGKFYVTPPRGSRTRLVHQSGATYAVGRARSTTTTTFFADAEGRVVGMLTRQNGVERSMRKIK